MIKINIKTVVLCSAFIACFAAIILVSSTRRSEPTAPDVAFQFIDGRQVNLSTQLGKPVLITFWATTCHLCLQEIPELMALYDEMKMSGLEIIGVAMPYDPPNRVLDATRMMGINYPVALDIDGEIIKAFGGVSATPTAFLISPEGTVIRRFTGLIDMHNLRMQILELRESAGLEKNLSQEKEFNPRLSGLI